MADLEESVEGSTPRAVATSSSFLPDRKTRLEQLVEERASTQQIGKAFGVGRERGRQLLHQAELYGEWKKRRAELPQMAAAEAVKKDTDRANFLSLVKHRRRIKAQKAG